MARGNIHYDQIRDDHRQGNGSKIAMSAVASPASNDVALYDANGNLIKLAKGSANQVLAMKGDGSAPVFKSLTAGSGASISHSDSEITIAASGGGGGGGGVAPMSWATFASLDPADYDAGAEIPLTDSPYRVFKGASGWEYFLPLFGRATPPPTSGWSTVNASALSLDTSRGGMRISATSGTGGVAAYYRAPGSTNWRVTAVFLAQLSQHANSEAGLVMRESSSGKLIYTAARYDAVFNTGCWNSATSFSSGVGTQRPIASRHGVLLTLRITRTATTKATECRFELSHGEWMGGWSTTLADFATPNEYGIALQLPTGANASMWLLHLAEEALP